MDDNGASQTLGILAVIVCMVPVGPWLLEL